MAEIPTAQYGMSRDGEHLGAAGIACDLLVIGGGIGGFAAAIRGQHLGLATVILEKSPYLGGVAACSGGIVWVGNNHLESADNYDDSDFEAAEYLSFISGEDPNYDAELREALLAGSREALEFYSEVAGIPFSIIGRSDQYYPDAPGSKSGGRSVEVAFRGEELGDLRVLLRPSPLFKIGLTRREISSAGGKHAAFSGSTVLLEERIADDFLTAGQGLSGAFLKAACMTYGAKAYVEADVRSLILDEGQVLGATAFIDGQLVDFLASRGVLIATGSYGYLPEAARMEGLPGLKEQSPPIITGDGMRLAEQASAAITRAGIAVTSLGFLAGGRTHPGTDEPLYLPIHSSAGYPHCIIVNSDGARFGDESFYGYMVQAIQEFDSRQKRFKNYPSYLIMDDRYRRQYSLSELDEWPEGDLSQADSLDELARKLGIDPVGLDATVGRFNQYVEVGSDEEFRRGDHRFAAEQFGDPAYGKNSTLGSIEEPPFWGVRLEIAGTGIYSMGVWINGHAQALTRDGLPVDGLYVTGNAAAYTEVLHGYEGGLANARGITYGFLAATHAASRQ